MTPQEWMNIAATIQARWPNIELPVGTLQQWGEDLADLPADQVAATVEVMYRDGREFAPNAGQIRKRLVELMLDPPEWGEVLEQLREIERAHPARAIDPGTEFEEFEPIIEHPRADVLARAHPMVVAFRAHLASQIATGVDDDGGSEARLRDKWIAFKGTAERRMSYVGIEPAQLPALERVTGSGRRRELRQASSVFSDVREQIARPALPRGKE